MWSLQAGIVLCAVGLGFWVLGRTALAEAAQGLSIISTLALALGLGFVASAGGSYAISTRHGLIGSEPRAQHAEREPFVLTYPHLQLSPRRALALSKRLKRLMDELIATPNEPGQPLYGIALGFFRAPQFLQPNEVREKQATGVAKATGVRRQASVGASKPKTISTAPVRRTPKGLRIPPWPPMCMRWSLALG